MPLIGLSCCSSSCCLSAAPKYASAVTPSTAPRSGVVSLLCGDVAILLGCSHVCLRLALPSHCLAKASCLLRLHLFALCCCIDCLIGEVEIGRLASLVRPIAVRERSGPSALRQDALRTTRRRDRGGIVLSRDHAGGDLRSTVVLSALPTGIVRLPRQSTQSPASPKRSAIRRCCGDLRV